MAIGFEIDANVEFGGSVMQPFDACGSADDGKFEGFGDVAGACTIGICRLYDADLQLVGKARLTGEVTNEGCGESSNSIAI